MMHHADLLAELAHMPADIADLLADLAVLTGERRRQHLYHWLGRLTATNPYNYYHWLAGRRRPSPRVIRQLQLLAYVLRYGEEPPTAEGERRYVVTAHGYRLQGRTD